MGIRVSEVTEFALFRNVWYVAIELEKRVLINQFNKGRTMIKKAKDTSNWPFISSIVIRSIHKLTIIIMCLFSFGCASTVTSQLADLNHRPPQLPLIGMSFQDIDVSRAYTASKQYNSYQEDLYSALIDNSEGTIVPLTDQLLRLSLSLTCKPPEPKENLGLGLASGILIPLSFIPDKKAFNYHVDYKIMDQSGNSILRRFLKGTVEGKSSGYYYGRKVAVQDLIVKEAKFVVQNSSTMVINDLYQNAEVLVAAVKGASKKVVTKKSNTKTTPSTLVSSKGQEVKIQTVLTEKQTPKVYDTPNLHKSFRSYWAVVIGISDYKYTYQTDMPKLAFADNDAIDFVSMLHKLGWEKDHIKLLVNEEATERNIKIALEAWLTKAGPNDQIVLFWAGHGFPDPEDPEKVYFACYDTDIKVPATGYRMDKVRTALEERKSKNVIVLADTCHAGKIITRGNRGISIIPNINKMSRENKVPKGWIFMVGADTDRQAIEHTSWTNGAFTHSLIKGLSGKADGFQSAGAKDGIVTMGELRSYMNTAMPDETQKVLGVAKRPVTTTSTGDPDIWNMTLQAK